MQYRFSNRSLISSQESGLRVAPCKNRIGGPSKGPCTDAASRMPPIERDTSVISDAADWLVRAIPGLVLALV
jgi:hypothetical protein